MVGQHGLLLAVALIKAHFGQLVSKVCECLLRKGALPLHEIAQATGFDVKRSKNCLLVLVQHNCVQAFSIEKPGPGGASKVVTLYTAIFENIIHRMRFAKFEAVVRKDMDGNCEIVIDALFQHGRLTFNQIAEHAASKKDAVPRDKLFDSLNKLVCARYVERCPKPEPFFIPVLDDGRPKRGADKFASQSLTLEKQALAAATLSDAERFSGLAGDAAELEEAEAEESSPRAGAKRKLGALDIDKETHASIVENEVLWRPNFEKFMQCLRRNLCAAKKSETLGPQAGCVLEALIDSGQLHLDTVSSTLDSIFERLAEVSQGCTKPPSLMDTRPILEALGCQANDDDGTTYYSINLKAIIKECQIDEVEDLVLKRYGKDAYRIFRLLSKNNQPYETDKISDTTFVDKKDTQTLLHKLWKDDYLHMVKMATAAGYGQKTFFLWRVNRKSLWGHYLDDMYHAAFNLKERIDELAKEASEIAGIVAKKPLFFKLCKRIQALEFSFLKLDDKIMLFHDFNDHSDL